MATETASALIEVLLRVKLSDCDCDCAYAYSFSLCVRVCTCVPLEDLKASWQLLIFHTPPKKKEERKREPRTMEPFHLAHPSFLCLSQIGWKRNEYLRGERVARKRRDNRARRSVQTTWWGCDLLSST